MSASMIRLSNPAIRAVKSLFTPHTTCKTFIDNFRCFNQLSNAHRHEANLQNSSNSDPAVYSRSGNLTYETCSDIVRNVNEQIESSNTGRLFAVVQLAGAHRKITTEDILCINGNFPPAVGERIRLEKVLLVGSKDFTIIGRPMLQRSQVKVEATVIEKTLEVPKIVSWYRKRKKSTRRMKLTRMPLVMLRINSIDINYLND
ncbi:large ribosomal subunit protein bL21m-like [Tubulanus polymorphus]|uniref:large ribosomal subunit protein bL21m-like n=1 Tax=Tubulanus polymorphus TaxID=672921 RepID=UPI003DA68C38